MATSAQSSFSPSLGPNPCEWCYPRLDCVISYQLAQLRHPSMDMSIGASILFHMNNYNSPSQPLPF